MGISQLAFKVATQDTNGDLFVLEQTMRARGGPPRHVHPDQDEWFYAVQGEYIVEIGSERFELHAGDSLLAPRKIPHVWAFVGNDVGRLVVAFTPAGKMEAFFREVTKANAMPSQDPAVWLAHGMQVVGPPLQV
jgi:quercetin dioxygenase-like cupin family protein